MSEIKRRTRQKIIAKIKLENASQITFQYARASNMHKELKCLNEAIQTKEMLSYWTNDFINISEMLFMILLLVDGFILRDVSLDRLISICLVSLVRENYNFLIIRIVDERRG